MISSAGNAFAAGGAGGTATGGDLNVQGDDGGNGAVVPQVAYVGHGGGTVLGGQVLGPTASANGNTGHTYGGGGSGAMNLAAIGTGKMGGVGAAGVCIVETTF
jgi:hypothetical protein